jgi:hypothetical protein
MEARASSPQLMRQETVPEAICPTPPRRAGEKSLLAQSRGMSYDHPMSATELIEQVAVLPPQERMLFERLFRAMENGASPGQANRTQWPDFGQRLHEIYGNKVAPDSQNTIDEGRGDR